MNNRALYIPALTDWLSSNQRIHWRVKANRTAIWRDTACVFAKQDKIAKWVDGRPCHIYAHLVMFPKRRAHIDPANYQDTAKAAVDGLVDAKVWPDDSTAWVTGPDMRLDKLFATDKEYLVLWLHLPDEAP